MLCKCSRMYNFCILFGMVAIAIVSTMMSTWFPALNILSPNSELCPLGLTTCDSRTKGHNPAKSCRFIAIEVRAPLMNALECPCAVSVCELGPDIFQNAIVDPCWTPFPALVSKALQIFVPPWTVLIDDLQVQPKSHLGGRWWLGLELRHSNTDHRKPLTKVHKPIVRYSKIK